MKTKKNKQKPNVVQLGRLQTTLFLKMDYNMYEYTFINDCRGVLR